MEAAFVPYGSVDWWVHRDSIAKAQQALRRPLGSYGVMANPRRRRQTSRHTPLCRQPGIDVQLIKFSERHSGVCLQPWLPKKILPPALPLDVFWIS